MFKCLLIIVVSLLLTTQSFAQDKSICGMNDDRVLSFNSKIGRLSAKGKHFGCTVTMISKTCGITAGHCKSSLDRAEFNTPISMMYEPQPSHINDVYEIDQSTIVSQNEGPGKDWAVFKFKRNKMTGKFPGQEQGYYNVSFKKLTVGQRISITGYGEDDGDPSGNFAQQYHHGMITGLGDPTYGDSVIKYDVDTMVGSSGSAIIDFDTQEVIGIHAQGGCHLKDGSNKGTIISRHPQAKKEIKKCLAGQ